MLRIENKTISINRGDDGQSFDLIIPINETENYTFQVGDIIKFGIYNVKALDQNAVLLKIFEVQEETQRYTLSFTKEEMTIGELINKPVDYWYELQLNGNTIIGFDQAGAKVFRVYPEGSDN